MMCRSQHWKMLCGGSATAAAAEPQNLSKKLLRRETTLHGDGWSQNLASNHTVSIRGDTLGWLDLPLERMPHS